MNVVNEISIRIRRSKWTAPILLLFIGLLITFSAFSNRSWEGGPDNYWHFYFSKYAFQYPQFFLHHWGKPLFILLSSPFAQLGFFAVNVFNICCGILSTYIVYRWTTLLKYSVPLWSIVLVLLAPMYLSVMQSALTEPLFSLILLASAFLIFKEEYIFGAILSSFLIYSRSEGLFILPVFMLFYFLNGKFKFLPLFAFAFIIYSLVGYFSGHELLWYFTENPYKANSPYGHGTWFHFLTRYDFTFGGPFLLMMLIGLVLLFRRMYISNLKWKELIKSDSFKVVFLAFIPSLLFFLFHVYAWYMGKYASAGVDRVMASVIPLAAIVTMKGMDLIGRIRFFIFRNLIFLLFFGFMWNAAFKQFKFPVEAKEPEKVSAEATTWFVNYREKGSTIYYANPAIVFYADYDPFDKRNLECFSFPSNSCSMTEDKGKFYYIWDSDFSEFSCGKSLSELENCTNLVKVKEFGSKDKFRLVFFESK